MTRGERIKDLMHQNDIEVKEMADSISKTVQYIYQLLKDEIRNPSVEVLKGIAKKLGVTIDYLEEGVDEEKIYYNEPDLLNRLPKDLQEFVVNEENTPYLVVAKTLSAYDLEKLTEREMQLLIDWLKMAIEKNKKVE